VLISVSLHELDFVALVRASRMLGVDREEVIRRGVMGYLVSMQRQGMDLGIQLPEGPLAGEAPGQKEEVKEAPDGNRSDS
jgi:hypothetical protein